MIAGTRRSAAAGRPGHPSGVGSMVQGALLAGIVCVAALGGVQDLERAFVEVNRKVAPCVVSLVVTGSPGRDKADLPMEEKLRRFFGEKPHYGYKLRGVGSGIIIDARGFILTNAHVVKDVEQVTVILHDGSRTPGTVLGRAPQRDLAVLKIEPKRPLPAAEFADAAKLRVGQFAIALGNPFALARDPEPTMTVGHISALRRTIPAPGGEYQFANVIQTDAAINPGNSGGPLVNIHGKVIGINAAIFTTTGGSIGIGFAIPMDKPTLELVARLKLGDKPEVGWAGITRCQALTPPLARYHKVPPRSGVLIVELAAGGPAARAGMKAGDIVTSLAGRKVSLPSELARIVKATPVGQEVEVALLRGGAKLSLRLKVAPRSFEPGETLASPRAWRGMEVEDLSKADKLPRKLAADLAGVLVTRVAQGSAAARAGLNQGDIIVKVNQTAISSARLFRQTTQAIHAADDVLVRTLDRVVAIEGTRR